MRRYPADELTTGVGARFVMNEFEQVKLVRIILYLVVIWFLVGAPIWRYFSRKRTPGTAADSRPDDVVQDINQQAQQDNLAAGKQFVRNWESRGVDPSLLMQFANLLTERGFLKLLQLDACRLRVKGLDDRKVSEALIAAYDYTFMTWPKFPYASDRSEMAIAKELCARSGISAIKQAVQHVGQSAGQAKHSSPVIGQLDRLADDVNELVQSSDVVRGILRDEGKLTLDQVLRLGQLQDALEKGVLSEEEFEAKKVAAIQHRGGNFTELSPTVGSKGVDRPTDAQVIQPRDKYTDLERLKRLLDDGALTQEEYDREKAKILSE